MAPISEGTLYNDQERDNGNSTESILHGSSYACQYDNWCFGGANYVFVKNDDAYIFPS